MELQAKIVHMPPFAQGDWLNTPSPLAKELLRGKVVLIDFWDYTCVNCIRTLPYVKAWHDRYADKGLVIIGIHAPEFAFARSKAPLRAAIEAFDLPYPVLLDNDYENWDRFATKAWPTKHLIDPEGYIRYSKRGERGYQKMERAIQALLREQNPDIDLPPVMPLLRDEDQDGAVCYRPTPELYAGYERGALGNREGYAAHNPLAYRMPMSFERTEGAFYVEGLWRAEAEALTFAGKEAGRVLLPYSAVGVNAVLSPSADPVEVALGLRPTDQTPIIEVWQNDQPLDNHNAGADIFFDDEGRSCICVDQARMFELVRHPDFASQELELIFRANGLALYSFTFTSCVKPNGLHST